MKKSINLEPTPEAIGKALLSPSRPHIEIRAVPGAGKTTLLEGVLWHLIRSGVEPEAVLVLSFAKESVKVLNVKRQRLANSLGLSAAEGRRLKTVEIATLHSFALGFLSEEESLTLLADRDSQRDMLAKTLRLMVRRIEARKYMSRSSKADRDWRIEGLEELRDSPSLLSELSAAVDRSRSANTEISEVLAQDSPLREFGTWINRVREVYAEMLAKAKKLDFPAMLERFTEWVSVSGTDLRYVLVDEYQDCSPAQVQILQALAENGAQIAVFGDPDQSIYGFGGGCYTPLDRELSGVRVVRQNRSHRLTDQAAALLNAMMGHEGEDRIVGSEDGAAPLLVLSESYNAECAEVARRVNDLIVQGVDPAQIVVLARTHSQLHRVEAELLQRKIDTTRVGLARDRTKVYQVLSFVALVRGLAKRGGKLSPADVAGNWLDGDLDEIRAKKAVPQLKRAVGKAQTMASGVGGGSILSLYVLCMDAYLAAARLAGETFASFRTRRIEALSEINRWRTAAALYSTPGSMRRYIESVERAKVTTATIHAAKGREWQHVFVVGATEGLLPIYHVKDGNAEGMDEEKRVLYVALSRASETLTVFHCPKPHERTRQTYDELSRFIAPRGIYRHFNVRRLQ